MGDTKTTVGKIEFSHDYGKWQREAFGGRMPGPMEVDPRAVPRGVVHIAGQSPADRAAALEAGDNTFVRPRNDPWHQWHRPPLTAANDNELPPLPRSNPKRAFGVRKPSPQFIPPVAIIEESVVMALGASKYGPYNWQDDPVDATTYYSAAMRHLLSWFSGEDRDPESGASHLAHVRACMAILLDASANGVLIDDRPKCSSASAAIDRLKVG